MKIKQELIEQFLNAGLTVIEMDEKSGHLKILGGVRHVEYYATTGTVYANSVEGKYPQVKGKGVEFAIKVALSRLLEAKYEDCYEILEVVIQSG